MTTTYEPTKTRAPKRTAGQRAAEHVLSCNPFELDECASKIVELSPWLAGHLADALTARVALARTAPKA